MRTLLIDCSTAGISGDMLLAGLLDLGVSPGIIKQRLESLPKYCGFCSSLSLTATKVTRGGFAASHVKFEHNQSSRSIAGSHLLEAYGKAARGFGLSERAQELGHRALNMLVDSEAALHGESAADVHLHEAGSVDTLCDILGTCLALEELGFISGSKIIGTHVAVGGGSLAFSHGTVPVPPPATLEILRRASYPFHGTNIDLELATPTGAALLTTLVQEVVGSYPSMRATRTGYGAGNADPPNLPNVLRLVEGELLQESAKDEVSILETTVDDVPGEVLGYTTERLLLEGARDAIIIPAFGKKNRPAFLIQVICDNKKADQLSRILFEETGTLGIRVNRSHRSLALRQTMQINAKVNGRTFPVRIKVSTDSLGKLLGFKPAYDDIAVIAQTTGMALRNVSEIVREQAKRMIPDRPSQK